MKIKNIILIYSGIGLFNVTSLSLAITFPFYIQNDTQSNCQTDLYMGKIVETRAAPHSVVGATIGSPQIPAGQTGELYVTLSGKSVGSITFQYRAIQPHNKINKESLLEVTYRTNDINNPIIHQIPKNLNFQYDPTKGYVINCH